MTRRKRATSWPSAISAGVVTFAMLVLLALAIALVVIPKIMSGMSLTVLTGSMEPTIMAGDVVVTKGIDEESAKELRIGDVITFLPYPDDPTLVTHRIIAKTVSAQGVSFTTQGDNNDAPDTWNPVHDYQIRGQVIYTIPKIGYVRQWLGDHTVWIIPGAAILLIGYGIITFVASFRKPPDGGDSSAPRRAAIE